MGSSDFLRPALTEDRSMFLMFLRARRFRPIDAAVLLAVCFEAKRDLFGDEILIHRITWDDLTDKEQAIFRSGAYQLISTHDKKGRGVVIIRMSKFNISDDDARAVARCLWYAQSAIDGNLPVQRNGMVLVADHRGTWESSPLQFVRLLSIFPFHAMPIHIVCAHILCDDTLGYEVVQTIRNALPKSIRMRGRFHRGSSLELRYALGTFGIDVSRQLFHECTVSSDPQEGGHDESIEEEIRMRRQLDDESWRSEASYRDINSPIALFPNPQDIIMGRNRLIAAKWHGNILYRKVIQQHVHRYIDIQATGVERIDKTLISVEILHIFQKQYGSRFLTRNCTSWSVIDDSEAQTKISQTLRALVRTEVAQKGR